MTIRSKSALFAATALTMAYAVPALAQDSDNDGGTGNDIIVTAQRIEQRLQDVPISVTVLNDKALANNNITSAKDIATFTPSLVNNNRYGSDNTTFTIRGFTQEQRTTATVGTYFADVVAPRGSGATQGGDGAGPGALFDLNNVQVLNGPQGTLFGRNSTGGAVLLVPRKPTDKLEGYAEASIGNYGMYRGQIVANIPLADTFKVRLGVDRMKRDGFQKNAGRIGFGPNGDAGGSVDYWATRLSVVADLTPDLENYTIATYSRSNSTGLAPKLFQCYSLVTCQQKEREDAVDKFAVSNPLPDAKSNTRQWQVINTTTWRASDNLTIKNLFSYGEFRGVTNLDLFGFYQPLVTPGTETNASQVRPFVYTHALPGGYTNAQSSLVEELQFQGSLADGKLKWQGGLYLEVNQPLGKSGVQTATFTPCLDSTTLNCTGFAGGGATSLGRLNYQTTQTTFNDKAAYFQASYDVNDQLKLTGGIRYTEDRMRSTFQVVDIRLGQPGGLGDFIACTNTVAFGAQGSATNPRLPLGNQYTSCFQGPQAAGAARVPEVKTSAPTWLLGVDYKPMDNVLLYAKWSRGYRQGGVTPLGADQLQTYAAEKVDTYEGGVKASWRGAVPGHFNFAGFYNNFRNQQLQIGLQCNPVAACAQTTAILNAGKSRLSGFEAELGISPFEGLQLNVAWAHLKTRVLDIANLAPIIAAKGLPFNDIRPIAVGSVLPNSIPDKIVASGSYTLPLPESVGKITFGTTWIFESAYQVVADNPVGAVTTQYYNSTTPLAVATAISVVGNGKLRARNYGNINVNWEGILGSNFDAGMFITNVTNKLIPLHINAQENQGILTGGTAEPRMFGFRLKYRFGN